MATGAAQRCQCVLVSLCSQLILTERTACRALQREELGAASERGQPMRRPSLQPQSWRKHGACKGHPSGQRPRTLALGMSAARRSRALNTSDSRTVDRPEWMSCRAVASRASGGTVSRGGKARWRLRVQAGRSRMCSLRENVKRPPTLLAAAHPVAALPCTCCST